MMYRSFQGRPRSKWNFLLFFFLFFQGRERERERGRGRESAPTNYMAPKKVKASEEKIWKTPHALSSCIRSRRRGSLTKMSSPTLKSDARKALSSPELSMSSAAVRSAMYVKKRPKLQHRA